MRVIYFVLFCPPVCFDFFVFVFVLCFVYSFGRFSRWRIIVIVMCVNFCLFNGMRFAKSQFRHQHETFWRQYENANEDIYALQSDLNIETLRTLHNKFLPIYACSFQLRHRLSQFHLIETGYHAVSCRMV